MNDTTPFDVALDAALTTDADEASVRELSWHVLHHPRADDLRALDPFSAVYKAKVVQLYAALRRDDRPYEAVRDEQAAGGVPGDLWREVTPFSFRDVGLAGEFFLSWGQIMRALALPVRSAATVLEYGSGSGQLALALARLGLEVSVVDVNATFLETVQAQAEALGLSVRGEQAVFGEGFPGETFDRIIFFEAFHHALDFCDLLLTLRRRLKPGGLLVLCGEPVVVGETPAVPYPWGPRLDGLSVYCMRKFGWMELGFTRAFLVEAMQRHGWLVDVGDMPDCFRAVTYVARPYVGEAVEVGRTMSLGPHEAGWHTGEGAYRWTRGGEVATFPLPDRDGPSRVSVRLSNLLPLTQRVRFYDGERLIEERSVPPGEQDVEVVLDRCRSASVGIGSEGGRPADVLPDSSDVRQLGIAVHTIHVTVIAR